MLSRKNKTDPASDDGVCFANIYLRSLQNDHVAYGDTSA